MIKIVLIRHSKTKGNLEGRYIGITDEHLCEEGISILENRKYPEVQEVYCSPMLRCIESSQIIYKQLKYIIYDDLRECSFGDFENKNYEELKNDKYYQEWIDSNGKLPFNNGEDRNVFRNRCVKAFDEIVSDMIKRNTSVSAIVAHGGTIMSILDKYSYPHEDFFYWQVKNGEGYCIEIDEEKWKNGVKLVTDIKVI